MFQVEAPAPLEIEFIECLDSIKTKYSKCVLYYSGMAQWQSRWLLTTWLLVRVQLPEQLLDANSKWHNLQAAGWSPAGCFSKKHLQLSSLERKTRKASSLWGRSESANAPALQAGIQRGQHPSTPPVNLKDACSNSKYSNTYTQMRLAYNFFRKT